MRVIAGNKSFKRNLLEGQIKECLPLLSGGDSRGLSRFSLYIGFLRRWSFVGQEFPDCRLVGFQLLNWGKLRDFKGWLVLLFRDWSVFLLKDWWVFV